MYQSTPSRVQRRSAIPTIQAGRLPRFAMASNLGMALAWEYHNGYVFLATLRAPDGFARFGHFGLLGQSVKCPRISRAVSGRPHQPHGILGPGGRPPGCFLGGLGMGRVQVVATGAHAPDVRLVAGVVAGRAVPRNRAPESARTVDLSTEGTDVLGLWIKSIVQVAGSHTAAILTGNRHTRLRITRNFCVPHDYIVSQTGSLCQELFQIILSRFSALGLVYF